MQNSYYLRNNLFIRECDGAYVFLDLEHNRYFTLSDNQTDRFAKILGSGGSETPIHTDSKLGDQFVEMGILTLNPEQGKVIESVSYSRPEFSIDRGYRNPSWSALACDLPRFLAAFLWTIRLNSLSHSKFDSMIQTVAKWKSRLPEPQPDARAQAIILAQRFHSLSPFFFTAHDACFFRSLFLVRYLALHGLAANWVFAVRLCPFGAHCWVEFDHVLLNEDYDRTLEYRPIMLA